MTAENAMTPAARMFPARVFPKLGGVPVALGLAVPDGDEPDVEEGGGDEEVSGFPSANMTRSRT